VYSLRAIIAKQQKAGSKYGC